MCMHVHDYMDTKFHMPSTNGSLDSASKPKAKENFGHFFTVYKKLP
jgi:hypothetical protein